MSDCLKTNPLLIGLHLTVNQVFSSLDIRYERGLGSAEHKKKKVFQKRALKDNVHFFIVNFPMRPELVFLSPSFY